jgi:hypothetical protein
MVESKVGCLVEQWECLWVAPRVARKAETKVEMMVFSKVVWMVVMKVKAMVGLKV